MTTPSSDKRPILTLKKAKSKPKTEPKADSPSPYSPLVQLVGKSCRLHLLGGMVIEATLAKVHIYELELADGRIVPKHAVLLVEPLA